VKPGGWKRRKDLHDDLGAGWRLRVASEKSANRFFFMLILSFSYFCAEMTFGVMSGSLAVLADAFHMLTDVAALVCGYWVAQLSMREKSAEKSFGWKRAEIVGALCNGCFLSAVCFTITIQAVEKLLGIGEDRDEDLIGNADKLIILGCAGLAINLGGMIIFGGHGHSHGIGECTHGHSHGAEKPTRHQGEQDDHGHAHGEGGCSGHGGGHGEGHGHGHGNDVELGAQEGGHGHGHHEAPKMNMNEWSMYVHVMGDALGSAFVVGNACIIKYGAQFDVWVGKKDARLLADPITSLIMVFIIMIQTVPLVRDTCLILMETAPAKISSDIADVEALEEELRRVPGVLDLHEFHLWSLNTSTFVCTVHVVLQPESALEINVTVDRIKKLLHRNNIHSSTIQTEILDPCVPQCDHNEEVGCDVSSLHRNASACADFVCDDGECITNSCCTIPSE